MGPFEMVWNFEIYVLQVWNTRLKYMKYRFEIHVGTRFKSNVTVVRGSQKNPQMDFDEEDICNSYDQDNHFDELDQAWDTYSDTYSDTEFVNSHSDFTRIQGSQNIIKYTAHHRFVRLYQNIVKECASCSKPMTETIDDLVYSRLTLQELKHLNPYGVVYGLLVYREPTKEMKLQRIQQIKDNSTVSEFDIVRYMFYIERLFSKEKWKNQFKPMSLTIK